MQFPLPLETGIAAGNLCRYDALNRTNRHALRFVEMTFTLDTGIGVDNVQNAIALADRFSRALG